VQGAGTLAGARFRVEDAPSDSQASDQSLVDAAARGDHAAFEALYRRHRDRVAGLAWSLTRDHDLSMDVLQETFAYLVRRLPTLRLSGRLTTFLYPAVKHIVIDMHRRRGRETASGETGAIAEAPQAGADKPAPPDAHEALRRRVDALPDGQREVVVMRFAAGMSLEEIATALGVPLGTVKSRLHHALARLGADGA
jgi:RNA polymerase sigma-70 factor (ECF subfamily)